MSIIATETPAESAAPPMKEGTIVVLIEKLRQMQEKANELAAQQLDLTTQIEAELKKTHELHQKTLVEQNDVGGEA
jgi:hypothetical protein